MERIQQTTTTYHTDGTSSTTSTVTVRELDDGEVGILLAGNNSILDPSLKPHMLSSAVDYAISESDDMMFSNSEDDEDHWFPSLSKALRIHDLEDDEAEGEPLYATHVVEIEEEPTVKTAETERPCKARKTMEQATADQWTMVDEEDDQGVDSDSLHSATDGCVPLNVVYTLIE
jgi:hypothetical protein